MSLQIHTADGSNIAKKLFSVTVNRWEYVLLALTHQAEYIGSHLSNGATAVMSCGWEGNRRSSVALTMRHAITGSKEMSTPPASWAMTLFTLSSVQITNVTLPRLT